MVKRSPFLDIKPKTNTVRKAKTGTTATVTDVLGAGRVEVQFGDDPENLATGRATGGVTAIGAEVAVEIDPVTGKLTSVGDPITIPEDAELVSTGITGETLLTTRETVGIVQTDLTDLSADHSRLDELTEELEEAQAALDADMEDLAADLAEANESLDDAAEYIADEVIPGLESAQGDAAAAAAEAALAMVTAQGIIKAGPDDPGHEKGRLWIQTKDGLPVGMKISDGEKWISYALFAEDIFVVGEDGTVHIRDGVITTPMLKVTAELWTAVLAVAGDATIGGNLIALESITAPHIVASEELSALVGKFLSVSTDQLVAGDAKITGDLLAENISGVNLYGVTVDGGEFWIRGVDKADVVVLHETFETGTPANGAFNGWTFVNSNGNAIVVRAADGISGNCARATYSGVGGAADPVLYFTPTAAQQAATVSGEVTVTVPMKYSGGMEQIAATASVKFTDGKAGKIALRVSKTVDGWDYWTCTIPHGAMLTEIRFTCVSSTAGSQSVWLDEVTIIKNNSTNASIHLYLTALGEPVFEMTDSAGGTVGYTPEPNIMMINGVRYQNGGVVRINAAVTNQSGSIYQSDNLTVPLPEKPAGFRRQITVSTASWSDAWASVTAANGTTSANVRAFCTVSRARQPLDVAWTLVPAGA